MVMVAFVPLTKGQRDTDWSGHESTDSEMSSASLALPFAQLTISKASVICWQATKATKTKQTLVMDIVFIMTGSNRMFYLMKWPYRNCDDFIREETS